jgi:hypothetical protein
MITSKRAKTDLQRHAVITTKYRRCATCFAPAA